MSFLEFLFGSPLEGLRAQARALLLEVRVPSDDPRWALNAGEAEVMDESESHPNRQPDEDHYFLTQIVRNPHGEYFLLKTTGVGGRPFVKLLSQDRAKLLLKARYRPPLA
jgi:hypothetical protein